MASESSGLAENFPTSPDVDNSPPRYVPADHFSHRTVSRRSAAASLSCVGGGSGRRGLSSSLTVCRPGARERFAAAAAAISFIPQPSQLDRARASFRWSLFPIGMPNNRRAASFAVRNRPELRGRGSIAASSAICNSPDPSGLIERVLRADAPASFNSAANRARFDPPQHVVLWVFIADLRRARRRFAVVCHHAE